MRKRNLLLSAVAAMAIGSVASAAPSIETAIRLQTLANVDIAPSSPGVWTLAPGTQFKVVVSARVNNPNVSDQSHSDPAGNGISLGLQNLTFDILTPGTLGQAIPDRDSTFTPPHWSNYTRSVSGLTYAFSNVVDKDADGSVDDIGATGMNNVSLDMGDTLPAVNNYTVAAGAFRDIVRGGWTLQAGATSVQLSLNITGANVYQDNAAADDSLAAVGAPATPTSILIQTVVVPEPATLATAMLGLGGLVLRRRRA